MSLNHKERDWIENHFSTLREMISTLQVDVAKLKIKSGIWGAIGASVVLLGAYLLRGK